MTFISYAQNFEDVMLWRALHSIENGFYIDAGAWSPDEDSVTRAFYERGWRGINIEPNPALYDQLCQKRPEDINIPFALSDEKKTLNLYVVVNSTGLSTTDIHHAQRNRKNGQVVTEIACKTITLNDLWDDKVGQKQVHFLKIDVEGAEEAALRGNDWNKNRPWIIVIEAVLPNTQDTTHHLWEHFLLNAKYLYVYSDGINRYYLAKEHAELASAFAYPPNIFDQFKLASHVQADADVQKLFQQCQEASTRHKELSREHQDLSHRYNALEDQYISSIQLLYELRQTRIYRLARKLGMWEWMEKRISSLSQLDDKKDTK